MKQWPSVLAMPNHATPMPQDQTLSEALARSSETHDVDFKSAFDPAALRDWLELIKDIAAFANSGGGHILVGLKDDGSPELAP